MHDATMIPGRATWQMRKAQQVRWGPPVHWGVEFCGDLFGRADIRATAGFLNLLIKSACTSVCLSQYSVMKQPFSPHTPALSLPPHCWRAALPTGKRGSKIVIEARKPGTRLTRTSTAILPSIWAVASTRAYGSRGEPDSKHAGHPQRRRRCVAEDQDPCVALAGRLFRR